jgi:hypothetical protein
MRHQPERSAKEAVCIKLMYQAPAARLEEGGMDVVELS